MGKLGIVLGCALFAVGCVTTERPPVTELKEGLNLLDVRDATWGSNAAYVKNGRVVYLETRIGALKPEIYRQTWPEDSANEIDVRFVDQSGRTFYVQRGGDNYVDPLWHADIAAHANQKPLDLAALDLDMQLAKEAAKAYRVTVPASFADHALQMNALDREPLPSKNTAVRARFEKAKAGLVKDQAYGSWDWVDGDRWIDTHLYSASTGCFAWICAAKHSATLMYKDWPSLTLVQSSCNHGRCYNGDSMGFNCGSYGWSTGASLTGEANSNTTAVSGGCATPYNWNSGGYDHLCNDDAAYELWQAKDARWDTSHGDNISFVWYDAGEFACNCQNTGCDGDWNRPNCP